MKKKKLKQLLRELQRPKEHPQVLLRDWLPRHLAELQKGNYKSQTLRNRTSIVKHIDGLLGDRPLQTLRPYEITEALRSLLPGKSSTAQRVLSELRAIYFGAISNGVAESNPALHVKMPVHHVLRRRLRFEDWVAMWGATMTASPSWVHHMLGLALLTAQRRADLAKMKFSDIHDGHLHVEQQKQAGKGYGAKIALPLSLRLDAVGMTLAEVVDGCRGYARGDEFLLRQSTGGPLETSSLSARFNEVLHSVLPETAYLPGTWPSLHEVRSLSARLFRAEGVDTQTLLGHKHAVMTALYEDDRGLSAGAWKRLKLNSPEPGCQIIKPSFVPAPHVWASPVMAQGHNLSATST